MITHTYKGYTITRSILGGYWIEELSLNGRPFYTKKLKWAKDFINTQIDRTASQVNEVDLQGFEVDWKSLCFNVREAWWQLAHDWGLYAVITRLENMGYKPSPISTFEFEDEISRIIYDHWNEYFETCPKDVLDSLTFTGRMP